jgi:hypothetical protein
MKTTPIDLHCKLEKLSARSFFERHHEPPRPPYLGGIAQAESFPVNCAGRCSNGRQTPSPARPPYYCHCPVSDSHAESTALQ